MHVIVLGSAAGGGVPQWNCACGNCEAARYERGVRRRTQDSLAVSVEGRRWVLLNASPDIRQQIERTPALWPRSDESSGSHERGSPIVAVAVTNGDLDHCLGLLSIREWTPFSFYATQRTYSGLVENNAMMRTLSRQRPHVLHRRLELGERLPLLGARGESTGLSITAFAVEGKTPLHLEALQPYSPEDNVGLMIEEARAGVRLAYVPGAAAVDQLLEHANETDCLFFDGTFWSDDELSSREQGGKSAQQMAHLPAGGEQGSLRQLAPLRSSRKIFTHLNNTNPMLMAGSAERQTAIDAGWTIAEDAMELRL